MAKATRQDPSKSDTTSDQIEQKIVAFAEQLGTLIGTVQGKTEGWLDREALGKELTHIRDGAAELLKHREPEGQVQAKGRREDPRPAPGPRTRRCAGEAPPETVAESSTRKAHSRTSRPTDGPEDREERETERRTLGSPAEVRRRKLGTDDGPREPALGR